MLASSKDLHVEKHDAHIEGPDTLNELHPDTMADITGAGESHAKLSHAVAVASVKDEALEFLRSSGGDIRYVSAEDSTRILRKIDRQ